MDKLINGEGAYKSLAAEFDGYRWHPPLAVDIDGFWHFPRALLPERLKQLVEADRDLRAHWDWLHPHERQRLVIQLDARRDPASPGAQDESDEDADFEREVRRWELEEDARLIHQDRSRNSQVNPGTIVDLELQHMNEVYLDCQLHQIKAQLCDLDSAPNAIEQKPAQTDKSTATVGAISDVELISAKTAAAVGESSVSQWYALQAEDPDAPAPAIREPRFVRWLAKDVAAYWRRRVERATETNERAAEAASARATKASMEAKKKRNVQRG